MYLPDGCCFCVSKTTFTSTLAPTVHGLTTVVVSCCTPWSFSLIFCQIFSSLILATCVFEVYICCKSIATPVSEKKHQMKDLLVTLNWRQKNPTPICLFKCMSIKSTLKSISACFTCTKQPVTLIKQSHPKMHEIFAKQWKIVMCYRETTWILWGGGGLGLNKSGSWSIVKQIPRWTIG